MRPHWTLLLSPAASPAGAAPDRRERATAHQAGIVHEVIAVRPVVGDHADHGLVVVPSGLIQVRGADAHPLPGARIEGSGKLGAGVFCPTGKIKNHS